MKKALFISLTLIYLIGILYFLLPAPAYPDLSRSLRSAEPGDNWEHPDQKGYYSDLLRRDVINEMRQKFTLKITGLTIPSLILNYPPENAQTLVRDQLKSNYLEEIIYPMRESLLVNGWEPLNDPQTIKLEIKKRSSLIANGKVYFSKVTLKPIYSTLFNRILVWTLIFPASFLVYKSLKSSLHA